MALIVFPCGGQWWRLQYNWLCQWPVLPLMLPPSLQSPLPESLVLLCSVEEVVHSIHLPQSICCVVLLNTCVGSCSVPATELYV